MTAVNMYKMLEVQRKNVEAKKVEDARLAKLEADKAAKAKQARAQGVVAEQAAPAVEQKSGMSRRGR